MPHLLSIALYNITLHCSLSLLFEVLNVCVDDSHGQLLLLQFLGLKVAMIWGIISYCSIAYSLVGNEHF